LKLWQKDTTATAQEIDCFTVGRDREMDLYLAPFDVLGNMAHARMLQTIGLLSNDELGRLYDELKIIYQQIQRGEFVIEDGVEDVHSQVEFLLTERLGEVGKKIHAGRSI
jgi:argininosuccinate lyase